MPDYPKILVYGYGNPGRQDDAVGVIFAEKIKKWAEDKKLGFIETVTNYQLNIEDAANICDKDLVIFADASQEEINGYTFTRLEPNREVDFTMHHVSPAFILHLCREIYAKTPVTYLVRIKGYSWDFLEEITPGALENLEDSVRYAGNFLEQYVQQAQYSM